MRHVLLATTILAFNFVAVAQVIPTPTLPGQPANKSYVDGVISNLETTNPQNWTTPAAAAAAAASTAFLANNEQLSSSPMTRGGLIPNLHNVCNTNMISPVDCSTAFSLTVNSVLSAYKSARVQGTAGDFYYFASSLTLPSNLTIDGNIHNPRVPSNGVWDANVSNVLGLGPGQGGFILATGASIVMANNDTLENFIVMPTSLVTSPTSTAALTEISNFAGTGILASGSFDTISNGTVIGFADGIDAEGTSGRFLIRDYYCENTTCLRDWNGRDYSAVDHIYANNLYTRGITYTTGQGGNPLTLVYRTGAVIDYENSSDDLTASNIQDYGHNTCVNIVGAYISHFTNAQCEVNINGAGTATTHGFVIGPSTSGSQMSNSNVDINGGDLSGRTYEIEASVNTSLTASNGAINVHGVTFGAVDGGTVFFVNLGSNVAATFDHNNFFGGPSVFNAAANTQITAINNVFWNTNTEFTLDSTDVTLLTDVGNQYWGTAKTDPYAGVIAGQDLLYVPSVNGTQAIMTIECILTTINCNLGTSTNPFNNSYLGKVYGQVLSNTSPATLPQAITGSCSTTPTQLNTAFSAISPGSSTNNGVAPAKFGIATNFATLDEIYNESATNTLYVCPSTGETFVPAGTLAISPNSGLLLVQDVSDNFYPLPAYPSNGVSCSGSPTGSFTVSNGIVTHC